MSDFKWYGEDADSVIFPEIQATAVYLNQTEDLVIRQEGRTGEEDKIIIIPKIFLPKFLEKISELQKEMN